MNTTPAALDILRALYNADEEMSGYDLIQATGRPSGTIYPLLARMDAEGLIARRTETREEWLEAGAARPIRKYYLISPPGLAALQDDTPWPIAIDPYGCGCTECLTGEYVPLERATDAQLAAMLRGEIRDNTNTGELEITVTIRSAYDDSFKRELDPALLGININREGN
jgi:DNA-binding PadR family transcriptional regulator